MYPYLDSDKLKDQITQLEDHRRHTQNALEMALSLGDFQKEIKNRYSPEKMFEEAEKRINRVISFEARAFYFIEQKSANLIFSLCKPDDFKQTVENEIEFLIDQGFMSWAIRERRGVTIVSKDKSRHLLLHVIATFSRIRGMFVGFFHEPKKQIPDFSIEILSIILRNLANALEGYEIYNIMRDQKNALIEAHNNLEHRVMERTSELAKANEQLTMEVNRRKKTDQALQESYGRLEEILFSLPAGIMIVDAKSHEIIEVNSQAVDMTGMSYDQIIGSTCHKLIRHSEGSKCPITDLNQHFDKSECKLLSADGGEIPIIKSVIKSMMGGRECLIECFIDISEHKALEHEQIKKEKLEGVIETAGAVCHELNQPLQSILGNTELIMMHLEDDNVNFDKFKKIRTQVDKMGKITKKLMSITKYEIKGYPSGKIIDINKASDEL